MFKSSVRQANFGLHVEIFRRTSRLGGPSCVFGLLFQPLSSAKPDPWRYLLLRERQGSEADRRNGGEQSDMGRGTDLGRGGLRFSRAHIDLDVYGLAAAAETDTFNRSDVAVVPAPGERDMTIRHH